MMSEQKEKLPVSQSFPCLFVLAEPPSVITKIEADVGHCVSPSEVLLVKPPSAVSRTGRGDKSYWLVGSVGNLISWLPVGILLVSKSTKRIRPQPDPCRLVPGSIRSINQLTGSSWAQAQCTALGDRQLTYPWHRAFHRGAQKPTSSQAL
ncbi:hypothetical protein RRG08_037698 [Elysia crispata]|uniref:Uncharacterized protein n=1 Tax=Elysia crispata TaxID=231223 RepID=A0AAE1A820_9GAST|nr:hypothetical protein RRG08_037698 [Elysia crispata]